MGILAFPVHFWGLCILPHFGTFWCIINIFMHYELLALFHTCISSLNVRNSSCVQNYSLVNTYIVLDRLIRQAPFGWGSSALMETVHRLHSLWPSNQPDGVGTMTELHTGNLTYNFGPITNNLQPKVRRILIKRYTYIKLCKGRTLCTWHVFKMQEKIPRYFCNTNNGGCNTFISCLYCKHQVWNTNIKTSHWTVK